MNARISCLLLAAISLWAGSIARAAEIARPKLEDLFATPMFSSVRLSPDGTKAIYLTDMQGRRGVALLDLSTGKADVLLRATDEDILSCGWKGNDYVIARADAGGNESFAILSVHVPTKRVLHLIESWGENNETRQSGQIGALLSIWRENPRKIIVIGTREAGARSANYYAVDVGTGTRENVLGQTETERDDSLEVIFDNAGRLRARQRVTEKAILVEARLGQSNAFTLLFETPRDLNTHALTLAEILRDNNRLVYVDYSRKERGEVVELNLTTGEKTKVLFEPPEGEVVGLRLTPDRSELVGVEYESDKPHTVWLAKEWAQIQAGLDQAFPNTVNDITSASEDLKRMVVHTWSDRDQGGYWLLDRTGPKTRLGPIGAVNPKLDPKSLAPMEPVKFAARDGLELHGYLTRPLNHGNKPLPFILHPHGGPYGIRDSWGLDPEVQFYASLGYAVLQVNYRGSGGYGTRLLEAGRFEWGAKMQDDLTDAVKWAIAQGIADPQRVAISGASYGGYAALAGVTFTPELYRCAINYVGVSDLSLLGEQDRETSRIFKELFFKKWVHPDPKVIHDRSPLFHVDAIRVPTLHAYGRNDPRVEFRHWKYLKAELDRLHKPYEALVDGEEGHGFRKEKGRFAFYHAVEAFLKKHMPADQPAAP